MQTVLAVLGLCLGVIFAVVLAAVVVAVAFSFVSSLGKPTEPKTFP